MKILEPIRGFNQGGGHGLGNAFDGSQPTILLLKIKPADLVNVFSQLLNDLLKVGDSIQQASLSKGIFHRKGRKRLLQIQQSSALLLILLQQCSLLPE